MESLGLHNKPEAEVHTGAIMLTDPKEEDKEEDDKEEDEEEEEPVNAAVEGNCCL
jgi:hypothetical protein